MSESLLSFSEVLLFGRPIHDLNIQKPTKVKTAYQAETGAIPVIGTDNELQGVKLKPDDLVLVQIDDDSGDSGIYTVTGDLGSLVLSARATIDQGALARVSKNGKFGRDFWRQTEKGVSYQSYVNIGKRIRGSGNNNFLGDQFGDDVRLARIYGFAYEGTYFELPEPCLFLVHGEGESATDNNAPKGQGARAPMEPTLSGVAAADFQFANDIRVWDYDKADYTIRMEVLSGQFEQVLLDLYFGFDSPAISGAKVSGAKVSGAKVSGAKVSGAKVSGAKVSGAKARGD